MFGGSSEDAADDAISENSWGEDVLTKCCPNCCVCRRLDCGCASYVVRNVGREFGPMV